MTQKFCMVLFLIKFMGDYTGLLVSTNQICPTVACLFFRSISRYLMTIAPKSYYLLELVNACFIGTLL